MPIRSVHYNNNIIIDIAAAAAAAASVEYWIWDLSRVCGFAYVL